MADRADRNEHSAVRTEWERQWELSALRPVAAVYGPESQYVGVDRAEQYM